MYCSFLKGTVSFYDNAFKVQAYRSLNHCCLMVHSSVYEMLGKSETSELVVFKYK